MIISAIIFTAGCELLSQSKWLLSQLYVLSAHFNGAQRYSLRAGIQRCHFIYKPRLLFTKYNLLKKMSKIQSFWWQKKSTVAIMRWDAQGIIVTTTNQFLIHTFLFIILVSFIKWRIKCRRRYHKRCNRSSYLDATWPHGPMCRCEEKTIKSFSLFTQILFGCVSSWLRIHLCQFDIDHITFTLVPDCLFFSFRSVAIVKRVHKMYVMGMLLILCWW